MYRLIALIVLIGGAVQADVVRTQKTTSVFWGANEATATHYYATDRSADQSTTKWTRGLMKTMTGGKAVESKTITRLDKEVIWTLDLKKKTYTEMTFAEFRDMINKGMMEMENAQGEEEEVADTTGEDMYEWTIEDKSDPNPKTINGWTCRNAQIVATGVNKYDENDKVVITIDLWNSEEVPGAAEITEFYKRYLAAIGLDEMAIVPGLLQAKALYEKQFAAVYEAAKKAPGESVTSLMEIKKYQIKGKNIGKAMGEAAQEEVLGKLPFGKKKKKAEEAPTYEWKVKFSSTSDLTEANTNAIDVVQFEIPDGFKKKDK